MSGDHEHVRRHVERLTQVRPMDSLAEAVLPHEDTLSPRLSAASSLSPAAIDRRWSTIGRNASLARSAMLNEATHRDASRFERHIENFIGTVEMPVGVAGPLRVCGVFAGGDYYVPMATTEAALVASCTRGAHVISRAGGCSAAVVAEAVARAPAFLFDRISDAGRFVDWVSRQIPRLREVAESTSRYAKLIDVLVTLEGANIYLRFVYEVGQAAGQNMVTIATDAACRWIEQNTPVKPRRWYVEANLSGDKKACAQSFQGIRGRKVVAEATLPGVLVRSKLQCTPEEMVECYRVSAMGGVLSGALGIQGHYANALAALYIATGQDAACVAESAMGVTRFETRDEDALYVSVTMPNVIVGTVGGGTSLPTARACLDILGLTPGADGSANALAEVVAGLCLAGELSIIAALAAGHFADAHRRLARGDTEPPTRETTP